MALLRSCGPESIRAKFAPFQFLRDGVGVLLDLLEHMRVVLFGRHFQQANRIACASADTTPAANFFFERR